MDCEHVFLFLRPHTTQLPDDHIEIKIKVCFLPAHSEEKLVAQKPGYCCVLGDLSREKKSSRYFHNSLFLGQMPVKWAMKMEEWFKAALGEILARH